MHILLTGATGFIGKNLLQALLNAGYEVTALVRPETFRTKHQPPESEKLHYVYGLFYDPDVLNAIDASLDAVVHLAAIRGAGKAKKEDYRRVNIQGTRQIIDFALDKGISRFLYLSTVGVLGTIPNPLPGKPENTPAPDGKYHFSKWRAEEIVRKAAPHCLRKLILRPTIVYGKYDNGFIPRMIHFIKKGRLLLPDRKVFIHLLSVNSLVHLIVKILALDAFNGRIYHVADKNPVEIHKLADVIVQKVGGSYRQMPACFFKAGAKFFSAVGRCDLKTSVLLLSQSWHYDISQTMNDLLFEPADTLKEIAALPDAEEGQA